MQADSHVWKTGYEEGRKDLNQCMHSQKLALVLLSPLPSSSLLLQNYGYSQNPLQNYGVSPMPAGRGTPPPTPPKKKKNNLCRNTGRNSHFLLLFSQRPQLQHGVCPEISFKESGSEKKDGG